MRIALDFDETYTRDPEFWLNFILLSMKSKHQVVICTARPDTLMAGVHSEFSGLPIEIYNTNYKAKKQYMDDIGVPINIWIDDDPFSITIGIENYPDYEG